MARLRKTSARWQERAREAAARVMVVCDGPVFAIDLHALFSHDAPLELEIGAGQGDFIIDRAMAFPERNFLAVELAQSIAQMMAVRAARRDLSNLRLVRMDARPLVNLMLPDRSLAACHIYFPDPWPKRHHIKHRLFTTPFVFSLSRKLAAGAPLFIATDVKHYADSIFAMAEAAGMNRLETAVPGADGTGFARKFLAAGLPVYSRAYAAPA
jgi:tRNA (guanine-N7-)-methyltransferase